VVHHRVHVRGWRLVLIEVLLLVLVLRRVPAAAVVVVPRHRRSAGVVVVPRVAAAGVVVVVARRRVLLVVGTRVVAVRVVGGDEADELVGRVDGAQLDHLRVAHLLAQLLGDAVGVQPDADHQQQVPALPGQRHGLHPCRKHVTIRLSEARSRGPAGSCELSDS
jgi:hypothetical protein